MVRFYHYCFIFYFGYQYIIWIAQLISLTVLHYVTDILRKCQSHGGPSKKIGMTISAVYTGRLPRGVMVEVGVWTSRRASRAATLSWMWGWRKSVAGKSARTRFCLSSPLCPQGSSLSWICLPPQACTGFRTHTNKPTWCSGTTLTHLHRWKGRFKSLLPVRIKGASVSWQAHVILHLQRSVLLLPTDVISFQLVLGLHNAPQHLTVGENIAWCLTHCFKKAPASQRHEV